MNNSPNELLILKLRLRRILEETNTDRLLKIRQLMLDEPKPYNSHYAHTLGVQFREWLNTDNATKIGLIFCLWKIR